MLHSRLHSRIVLAALSPLLLAAAPAFAADAGALADGAKVYEQACKKCHSGGPGGFFTGAPKIGSPYLDTRLAAAGSIEPLIEAVKNGKGKMPPQGGASGLSEADLRVAVEFMMAKKGS